ncbi:MAG: hypothetical protein M1821_002136 [Bathelium mastoideum]|nr:MAG: hypothetical protein M1821_002136 [Bathelium mastoideum]
MPPKNKKPAGPEKGKQGEEEREEPLQAVILADSFETKFAPFTLEKPRCLLPLANTPLIEYTFEFLANAGVEEVYVYCGAHTDQVEEYINLSKWSATSSPFAKLEPIRSTSTSIGDAMRDLDKRGLLANDFLVVYGDVVSNLDLAPALAAHRARRARDKNAIMTMVLRSAGPSHRTKAQARTPIFVLDPTKDRCLHYEQIVNNHPVSTPTASTIATASPTSPSFPRPSPSSHHHRVTLDPDLLAAATELDVRTDLIDPGIDICTPDVLALWSDYFDHQAPRAGFLHSVLKDWELNGKTVHVWVVEEAYAARVRDLAAYAAVCRDVIGRWAYPLAPDSNLVRGQGYRLVKGGVYRDVGVVLARNCLIGRGAVLGRDAVVGDGSVVIDSVIGKGCRIGKNVRIEGVHLWDGAIVRDGSSIRQAIVADNATVGKNCIVEPGALISFGVRIGDGVTVKGTSRITHLKRDGHAEATQHVKIVGERGAGYEYTDGEDEDDEEERGASSLLFSLSALATSTESISTLVDDSDDDVSQASGADGFQHDAAASIFDSMHKGDKWEDIQVELMALRLSTNASDYQVRKAIAVAFMKRIEQLAEESGLSIKSAVKSTLQDNKGLIERNLGDVGKSEKADQVAFLLLMQADLIHRKYGDKILAFVCTELYKADVLEKEAFEQWWEDEKSSADESMRQVRERTKQFMDVLREEDEEESEEDEDEDEDEGEGEEEDESE